MSVKNPKYTHLSQRNQILKRPSQHIGSTKTTKQLVWIANKDKIVEQEIAHNPGLIHIFYEVLGNAQDNYFRSKGSDHPLKKIEVNVDKETGEVSVWNDGLWIPNVVHEWEDDEEVIDDNEHYEAEIIFGHLNSSSNYHDEKEDRVGGGLHGVGVKLTNIFSTDFTVEAFDPDHGLKFVGNWENNMSVFNKPKISKLKQKKGYTKVTYKADFTRFGVKGYTAKHLAVMRKLCVDCAMITGQKVIFNGEALPIKDLLTYVGYYTDEAKVEFKSGDSTVVVCQKPAFEAGLSQMSWVNGINTARGGVHVNQWKKDIFQPLLEKIKSKYSKGKQSNPVRVTMKTLEQYLMLFVNCNLNNPEFDGQTKGTLNSPVPKTSVPASKITTMMKWGFMDEIEETVRIQGMKELRKTDGKKTSSISIPKAVDANKAGTVKSNECTLFITEGDSAKAFAVKGISALDRGTDWYGVLPVRGKVLNVRGKSADQINKNKEITDLKKILGLRNGVDYSDDKEFQTLRYGRIRILTDADPDGDHIKGLVINFFQYFFPELITRSFVTSLRTPIVKAQIGKKIETFYYLKDFKDWAEGKTKFKTKYYKGLGTSQDAEILEIFENPRYIRYIDDKSASATVKMVFEKEKDSADNRKLWLENYTEEEFVYEEDSGEEQVPISEFFNNEMIRFSIYDNQRSIPSVVDGFKPSQRKAMWVGLKVLNTTKDYKVAQFAAEVAKVAQYHHGEVSMQQAIVGMAQTFVGANNIALFYEAGQFGTRLEGGTDAAAARYIFTRLASVTRYIFRKEDDPILDYLEDDGQSIEPRFFVPIVPMLLVNGCTGIGTGYSSNVPAFNPLHLVQWIRAWIDAEGEDTDDYPELIPWYWGFKGVVKWDDNNAKRVNYYGNSKKLSQNCYEISELPIKVWTDDYKETLDTLKAGTTTKDVKTGYDAMTIAQLKEELGSRGLAVSGTKKVLVARLKDHDKENGTTAKKTGNSGQLVTKWEWYGDAYNVNFKVWTKPGVVVNHENPKFKLVSSENLSNMTAFTPTGGIKKYDNLTQILNTYCKIRFKYYQKRKKHLLAVLKDRLAEQESKARFIAEALENFELLKQTEAKLFAHFSKHKYWKKEGSFEYLTSMPIRNFTTDHKQKLLQSIKETKAEISYIKKKTPAEMWNHELDEFITAYTKWRDEIDSLHKNLTRKKKKL